MEQKLKETRIPEDFSKALSKQCITLGPTVTPLIATILFDGVSKLLGDVKSKTTPKAVIFRSIDKTFLAGAKVEYIESDSNDPTANRWDYIWTFYEDDLKGADIIDTSTSSLATNYFEASGISLYKLKFADSSVCILMMSLIIEMIKEWLRENTTQTEGAVLVHDGSFKAMATLEDGKCEMGIIPAGEMTILIKDDVALQN